MFGLKKCLGLQKLWTPVLKQCFVTAGVSLNMSGIGLVLGFAVVLLEQLKAPGSAIPIDDEEGSWIASLPGIFFFAGTLLVVPIMGVYGRRAANLASITLLIIAWAGIIFAPNIIVLLIARALQGVNMGMSTTLGSLLIGEYTSPKNRGAFLMTISVSLAIGVLCVHTVTIFMSWRMCALVCVIVALMDLVVVFLSPESPSWLASEGKYEECKKVYHWLRGDLEEEELDKMIEACIVVRNSKKEDIYESYLKKLQKKLIYFRGTVRKKEFYKPLIIAGHIYTLAIWSGVNVIVGYPTDYIHRTIGYDVNASLITTSLDIQRTISCIFATYIIKKITRRLMLLITTSINVTALLAIAVYTYIKDHYTISFDHPIIGIILSHCMMFAIATGTLPLSYTITGEIFSLEDKTLAGGISTLIFSIHLFLVFKTMPHSFVNFGVYGTFCINATILCYCFLVVWFLLPETKDRTLQDIEDEFRGKPLSQGTRPDLKPHTKTSAI